MNLLVRTPEQIKLDLKLEKEKREWNRMSPPIKALASLQFLENYKNRVELPIRFIPFNK